MTQNEELKNENNLPKSESEAILLLYNDDFNTFDFIIENLTKIVNHSEQQAIQCALIAHNKGKSIIKKGAKDILTQLRMRFSKLNITTIVETMN